MRRSHAIKATFLCVAWVLCLQAAPASAPSNRPADAVRTNAPAQFAGPILALNRRGFVECGAIHAPPRIAHRVAKRDVRRLRRVVSICAFPKID
jgi:hypothetical protein